MEVLISKTILFVRMPGLLARSALSSQKQSSPLIVTSGRFVRDACPRAAAQGVKIGAPVAQARRLCPALLAVPLEEVDAGPLRRRFLDILANLSPVVEPDGPDAAYTDLDGAAYTDLTGTDRTGCRTKQLRKQIQNITGLTPVIGSGISRLAARACAESGTTRLEDAAVDSLWAEDPAVIGRLQRLGLETFGAVAALSESALRPHFGKIVPLLHRRARGMDLTPVRALYPPPCADVTVSCEDPLGNREQLRQVLARASLRAAHQLAGLGAGRLLTLEVETERGSVRQEWAVPVPVEKAADIERAAWRMVTLMRLAAPVTGVHLLIEDVSIPAAHTADLFGIHADAVALEAVRRRLSARFGLTTLRVLGQQPRTSREKRRGVMADNAEAFQRLTL